MREPHWNCRVIEFTNSDGSAHRSIHEVFYEDGKLMGYAETPAGVLWEVDEGDESPRVRLKQLSAALDAPVLKVEDFNSSDGDGDWLDDDGYPTEAALKRIAEWPYTDIAGMLAFAQPLWSYPDRWWTESDVLHLSTGGWSGNESIIGAMEQNRMFMAVCWVSSRRGGHYEFDLTPVRTMEKSKETT